MISKIIFELRKIVMKKKWRNNNSHNFTSIGIVTNKAFIDFVNDGGITVGDNTYGRLNVNYTGADGEKLVIGSNCSIAGSSNFLLGGEHDYRYVTTYPYAYRIFNKKNDVKTKGPIVVDDEVWIGDAAWIMSGVHIGKGAVVGTGAIVTKDVPPYAIVAGCPAKIIKYRFSDTVIKKLLYLDLNKLNLREEDLDSLSTVITDDNIDEVLKKLGVGK